jgi:mono/diheme cytochrome c family protein
VRFLIGGVAALTVFAGLAALFVVSGSFDVAATRTPGRLEETVATFALDRSIARHAPAAHNPLSDSLSASRAGLATFRRSCVACHGAPGVDPTDFGASLNPPAPGLTLPRVRKRPDGELFWIVRNGIRMTGMPAFGPTHSDREIWEIVTLVRHLPDLTDEERRELASNDVTTVPAEKSSRTR